MNGLFSGPYFTVRAANFKRVFYLRNTFEGNETYLKGKVEEKEQTSEAEMPDFRQSGHRQFFLYHDVIKHGLHRE